MTTALTSDNDVCVKFRQYLRAIVDNSNNMMHVIAFMYILVYLACLLFTVLLLCLYYFYLETSRYTASFGGFVLGISLGWNSSAGIVLRNNLNASATEIGLIGAILNAGNCLGALLMMFLIGRVPRRILMFTISLLLYVSWILLLRHAGKMVSLYLLGRLLCGISCGALCVLTPIYVADVACKENRGRLLALFQVLINCGIFYAFFVAHLLGEQESVYWYSMICGVGCMPIVATALFPESPLHYLSRNDETNAIISLMWNRGTYENYVQEEISELKQLISATQSKKCNMKLLTNGRVLRSIASCFGVMIGQQLSGINMMTFYALTFFDNSGTGELTGSEHTLVVGVVQILASLLAIYLVGVFGRRFLLTISTLLMGLFLILLGWFYSLRDADPENDDIYSWMSPTWTALIFASFNLGIGPISWSILGDTLPQEVKVPVASVAVATGWLISLIAILMFEDVVMSLGFVRVMILSAATCWFVALFCVTMVKDNSGKSLAEIQKDFRIESNRGLGET